MFHKCEICGNETNFFTSHRSETYPVLGEDIAVFTPHFICGECGAIIFDEKLDDESLKAAYEPYPFPLRMEFQVPHLSRS